MSKNKVVVLFNGWGMDRNVVDHLTDNEWDLIEFSSYHNEKDLEKLVKNIEKYEEKVLISFSLGVYMAPIILKEYSNLFSMKIAINGTLIPYDDKLGIPKIIFDKTLEGWSTATKNLFNKRILRSDILLGRFLKNQPARSINDQKSELKFIKNSFLSYGEVKNIYDIAIISDDDRIFPKINQIGFWNDKARYKLLDSPHFPFYIFESFSELMEFIKN
ncbi:MAG: hypothetical protein CR982_03790 [Candidatus Cloacimonadota bacterium]|nr:MAG: hypothetical protein CR982_03790 [Candidatus Cloacimonadota bacterium]PIE78029.1 MAG: hypothetical protein CSA15_09925 [Candidatus Delongbacteria bacterium]